MIFMFKTWCFMAKYNKITTNWQFGAVLKKVHASKSFLKHRFISQFTELHGHDGKSNMKIVIMKIKNEF